MKSLRTSTRPAQRGFTLVELMVGLVLGMLTVLVITQVLSTAEGTKRSITMGSDAQVNGALSLFTLQREIQQAGYGATQIPEAMGCQIKGKREGAAAFSLTLAPVVIANGGATPDNDAPDTITVLQARTSGVSTPMLLTGNHSPTDTSYAVASSFGAVVNNMMIAVPKVQGAGTWCTLFNVTNDASAPLLSLGPTRIPNATGTAGPWNHSEVYPAAGYALGDSLLNMGSLVSRTYSISNAHSLAVAELSATSGIVGAAQELYPQIVNLQAFYGKDTNSDGVVDLYDATTPLTNDGWKQVLAIRIAVVARSNQFEKEEVTTSAPLWDVGSTATFNDVTTATCGSSKCISLKVDQIDQWKHYRYKIFDTIVPLRNVLWNS
ncbi:PilW family protein [Variovorax ginsengisoli]|uniref:PilW family protein n=1 Tax=Variovorax ginsengisoli TaxID=363844 RepID=A0ABT8RY01_9BURK|nr:PilW family protein [Variovorax ginsengisoli]MDN8612085.1 PilW family protein [Variovorax ginsengisoli]MDO1531255.1 PilW family protein [Variovorax ginsengisoli]